MKLKEKLQIALDTLDAITEEKSFRCDGEQVVSAIVTSWAQAAIEKINGWNEK